MSSDRESAMTFYTADKRKIVIEMKMEYKFQKGHRGYGENSADQITVTLAGPDFKTIRHTFEPDVSFQNMAIFIKNAFVNRESAKGQPYDLWSEHGSDVEGVVLLLSAVAEKLKMPFTTPVDKPTMWRTYLAVSSFKIGLFDRVQGTKEAYKARIIEKVEKAFPGRKAVQANQIIAIFEKAMAKVSLGYVLDITKLSQKLGVKQAAQEIKPELESVSKSYGDFKIFREGKKLMVSIDGQNHQICEINNSLLESWKKPSGNNQRLFLDYASQLCDFLNENHFVVNGYPTFLAQFFNLVYSKDSGWKVLDDVKQPMESIGNVEIFKAKLADSSDNTEVFASIDGEYDYRPEYGEGMGVEQYRAQEPLFEINDKNEIVSISSNLRGYLTHQKNEKDKASGKDTGYYSKPKYDLMYSGQKSGEVLWDALIAGGFDPLKFIEKEGYGFSPKLATSGGYGVNPLSLFGLIVNRDTGKIGKTLAEIAKPEGTYAGLEMYSIVRTEDYSKRHYVFLNNGKVRQALVTETDSYNGVNDLKVIKIVDDLSPEERMAIRDLLKQKELPIPTKFKTNLSIGKKK